MEVSQTSDQERAAAIIAERVSLPGASLPILHALQAEFGAISDDHIRRVAEALNLSRAEVFGIVSFYHDFRRHEPGRHVLRLCRAEACQSLGADDLADHARARLGIDWHGTTTDGSLTLEPVFCLGLCASGPAAMLDERPIGRLDPVRLDRALDAVRQ